MSQQTVRKGRDHSIDEVTKSLRKKGVTTSHIIMSKGKVLATGNFIEGVNHNPHLGNSSWGKIDFLTKHNNYKIIS